MKSGREEINRELQESGSLNLAARSRETGYGIPEGYFDTFSQAVQQKISAETIQAPSLVTRHFNLRTVVSMAATFVLLIGLGISFMLLRQGKEEGFLGEFDDHLYDEYFARVTQFDRTMLYDLIFEQETGLPETKTAIESDDDYLFDYLLDAAQYYGIEPTELITQNGIDNQR